MNNLGGGGGSHFVPSPRLEDLKLEYELLKITTIEAKFAVPHCKPSERYVF